MNTYPMNQPHTKAELNTWPLDLQTEYMTGIINRYHPSGADLGLMLGIHPNNCSTYLRKLGLSNRKMATESQAREFAWFLANNGNQPAPDPTPDPEPQETAQDEPTATIAPDSTVYTSLSVSFTGTVQDLLRAIITGPLQFTAAGTYTFTVTAERRID